MLQNRFEPVLDPRALARQLSNKLLIDGALVPAVTGRTFAVVNPATQEHVGDAAEGTAPDVDVAVRAAAEARKAELRRPGPRRRKPEPGQPVSPWWR